MDYRPATKTEANGTSDQWENISFLVILLMSELCQEPGSNINVAPDYWYDFIQPLIVVKVVNKCSKLLKSLSKPVLKNKDSPPCMSSYSQMLS